MKEELTFAKVLLERNSLLIMFCGLFPALTVASTAKNAAVLGCIMLLMSLAVNVFASFTRKLVKGGAALIVYMLFAALLSYLFTLFCLKTSAEFYNQFSIYLPLIGVSSAVIGNAFIYARAPIVTALGTGLANGYGYAFGLLILGFVRELLADGSIFGMQIFKGFEFFSKPYGVLLILACVAAAYRAVINKAKEYEEPESEAEAEDRQEISLYSVRKEN